MVNQKPLPALPLSKPLAALSVDSRQHRTDLLKHFLADIHEPGIESRRDGWVHVFEQALDELSFQISKEDWLSSILRGRHLKQCLKSGSIKSEETGKPKDNVDDSNPLLSMPPSPLQLLHNLSSRPALPLNEKLAGHLVLCITPHSNSTSLPAEDSGFDILPDNIACTFLSGSFDLNGGDVLYGLEGLVDNVLESNLRLIGGTFTLKGVNSPMQHMLLSQVLRLGLYVQMSLILEQHLLADNGVEIKFSRPNLAPTSSMMPIKEGRARSRTSLIPSSFTNFLKRSISYRSQTNNPFGGRRNSLDITVNTPAVESAEPTVRKSFDGLGAAVNGLRLNRFSFMGSSIRRPPNQNSSSGPFVSAVRRIEDSKELLSSSPGVMFEVPKPLLELAEKDRNHDQEDRKCKRRLKGDERIALTSLLGWEGKESEGRGMSGITGFVRQQEISVLCSLHVPHSSLTTAIQTTDRDGSTVNGNAATSTKSTTDMPFDFKVPALTVCGKHRWITYRYYKSNDGDSSLGDYVHSVITKRNSPCERSGCKFTQGDHERRVIHDGIKIIFRVSERKSASEEQERREEKTGDDDIEMWSSCHVCNAKSSAKKMSIGTYLMSYAKFLEILIYSPWIWTRVPPLCEHTVLSITSPALSPARFNFVFHFGTAFGELTTATSIIQDIFDLKVPRLQFTHSVERLASSMTTGSTKDNDSDGDRKKILRKEIRRWWEGVSDHIDKIERILNADETTAQKALPRLPSVDDAYEAFDLSAAPPVPSTPGIATPIHYPLPRLPPSTPQSPSKNMARQDSYFSTQSQVSAVSQTSKSPAVPPKDNSGELLTALRHNFQEIEQSLYTQLARTPGGYLNDVRRAFIATGKGTEKRLKAWQKKHLGSSKSKLVGNLVAEEPEWWGKGCHALPGGKNIVREDDMGSIIAHTLSAADYQLELANLSILRSASGTQPGTPSPTTDTSTSSFFAAATGYKLFSSSSKAQPDPDQENVVWNEPESYSAVITRKSHIKDPASFLSIRDVMRQKTNHEQSSASSGSRFTSLPTGAQATKTLTTSAKAKPDVGLSMQAADGELEISRESSENTEAQRLHELESASSTTSRPSSLKSEATISNTNASTGLRTTLRIVSSSHITTESEDSTATVIKDNMNEAPPPLPPKDVLKGHSKPDTNPIPSSLSKAPPIETSKSQENPPSSASVLTSTLAHGLSSAMRFVLRDEHPSSTTPTPEMANPTVKPHALLADINFVDERPHIKYDWTIGKRLKFSCTVYYAKQFDILRKRCGISDTFVQSLSKSTNWEAEGGKSKSNFWKTSDDRFIIKTLVNAWNIADLQVLVELAPSYFKYMDSTSSRATVLAKLLGFYTIEIRNLETGTVQTKVDLLVMENLFFGQTISKTFDLKGIQGRRVKSHGDTTKTFFDGEWIEGQQRTLTLVRPHSKAVLQEAVRCDADYLSKSNIMDYSLLLGVNEEKKEIICGLVDTIGSYTFAKTLEYKAKQGLQSGKEVTVMPPTEYQERFVNALDGYFVACPDKWSKPIDESKIISDPNLLPSVL